VNEQKFWTEEAQQKLRSWFSWLQENRGDRARMRRAETPDDVVLSEPFFNFLRQMPEVWALQQNLPIAAMIAAVLAHVKDNDGKKSFAAQLASTKPGTDRSRMSELRFQQLQKSRTPDEFFRRLIRAVKLADGQVNILSLADSIRRWMNEYRYGTSLKPFDRLAVRWANDYYVAK
jgi:CRISPR system Cascade subunit CasB